MENKTVKLAESAGFFNGSIQIGVDTSFLYRRTSSEYILGSKSHNDCAVRAIAAATESTYDEAYLFCKNILNRKDGHGTLMPEGFKKLIQNGSSLFGRRLQPIYYSYMNYGSYIKYASPAFIEREKEETLKKLNKLGFNIQDKTVLKLIAAKNVKVAKAIRYCKKGTYIVIVKKHAFTIIDGVVYGNSDDAIRKSKEVKFIWKLS